MSETARVKWCPGPELNRYVSFETRDFKSRASASFATRAVVHKQLTAISLHCSSRTKLRDSFRAGGTCGGTWFGKVSRASSLPFFNLT
jgi:hypothetical protein